MSYGRVRLGRRGHDSAAHHLDVAGIGRRLQRQQHAGQWSTVSPGTVIIDKSQSVLTVRCNKGGWSEAVLYIAPRMSTTAMVGAFMPYVGIVDAAVNASSGAAMVYPQSITLTMTPSAPPASAPPPSGASSPTATH